MNITHPIASLIPVEMVPWITPILILFTILLGIVFFRPILQLLGVVIIPENKIGLVTKKFAFLGAHTQLPSGSFIALRGEAALQAQTLAPGLYLWKWIWQYEITLQPLMVVPEGSIGHPPFSPPSGPTQWLFRSLPQKANS